MHHSATEVYYSTSVLRGNYNSRYFYPHSVMFTIDNTHKQASTYTRIY